jgi:hypothetical protein
MAKGLRRCDSWTAVGACGGFGEDWGDEEWLEELEDEGLYFDGAYVEVYVIPEGGSKVRDSESTAER